MTTKKTILGVEVTDGGSAKKVEKQVGDLRSMLKGVTKDVQALNGQLGKLNTGGTAGSQKAASLSQEHAEFDRNRGIAQSSGAAGRDFANQARGLDGLVRLYATFAANIFAVSVAFRGLSDAMDTSNMVKGLDQLGAAVGRNLGGLGKRVAELSGGAISLAEALKAVAQTSSAGIATKDIERLAGVARSASAALGVAMPDAISRLSRGITKLEPELLDELGIMTRLDPAVAVYARSVGKATSQLTQFERRQAFANAVLSEGEAKFGAIANISVNPYDRLLSSIKDLAQVGAEMVNRFLVPVVDLLSSSPTALVGIFAIIAKTLGSQALPELGRYKEGLVQAAQASADFAQQRADASIQANKVISDNLESASKKEAALIERRSNVFAGSAQRQEEAGKKIEAITGQRIKSTTALAQAVYDSDELSRSSLKRLEQETKKALAGKKAGNKELVEQYNIINREAARQAKLADQIDGAIVRETKRKETFNKVQQGTITGILNERLAKQAAVESTKKTIVSNAAHNASLIGVRGSLTLMNIELAKSGVNLTAMQVAAVKASAGLAIMGTVVSAVTTAVFKLSNLISVVGVIFLVFSGLSAAFSRNSDEAEAFSSAIDNTEDSLANMSRTLAFLDKQASHNSLQGIQSLAEAFSNLNSSIEKTVETAQAKLGSAGIFDKVVDFTKGIFGFGTADLLSENLTKSILSALDALDNTGLKDDARAKFKDILGIDSLGEEEVHEAVKNLGQEAQKGIVKALNEQSLSLSNASSRLESFKLAADAAALAQARFIQSTANTNPVFVLGASLQTVASTMFDIGTSTELATQGVEAALDFLNNNLEAGALLGGDFVHSLIAIREEFGDQELAIKKYEKELATLDRRINSTQFDEVFTGPASDLKGELEGVKGSIKLIDKLQADRKATEADLIGFKENQAKKTQELFTTGLQSAFEKGSKLIEVALGQATEKGALTLERATLAGLSGENLAKKQNDIARKEVDIRLRAIDTNINLIQTNTLLRAAIEKSTATQLLIDGKKSGKSAEELEALETATSVATLFNQLLSDKLPVTFAEAIKKGASKAVAQKVGFQGVGVEQAVAAQKAAKIAAEADREALGITGRVNINKGILQDLQQQIDLQAKLAQAEGNVAAAAQRLVGIRTVIGELRVVDVQRNKVLLDQSQEILAIDTAIMNASSENERIKQEGIKVSVQARQEAERNASNLIFANQLISARLQELDREVELTKSSNALTITQSKADLQFRKAQLDAVNQVYSVTADYGVLQTNQIAQASAVLELEKAKVIIAADLSKHQIEAAMAIKAIQDAGGPDAGAQVQQVRSELERQQQLAENKLQTAQTELTVQQRVLEITKNATLEMNRQNRVLAAGDKISSKLSSNFGKMGDSIGKLSKAFTTLAVDLSKGVENIKELRKAQSGLSEDSDEYAHIQKLISNQHNENNIRLLDGYANAAGAAKTFFEEGTKGYKVLAGAEKAFTVVSLALTAQRLVSDIAATAATIANSSSRIAADIAETEVSAVQAVVNTMASIPFPANVAAGAVVAGLVAALVASIGGSGPKVSSTGFTAEDTQKVQGTGRGYQNGKLTDTGGGALGTVEKVKDISNSLELIEATNRLTSVYGVRSYNALEQIERNTRSLTAALLTGTSITKNSSAFGTDESSIFKSTIGDASVTGIAQKLGLGKGVGNALETVFNPISKVPVLGGIASAVASFVGSLFGSKKKIEIIDKGISAAGSLADILSAEEKFKEFETLEITKTKKAFGITTSKKKSIEIQERELADSTNKAFTQLFDSMIDSVTDASAQVFGKADSRIQDSISTFFLDFKVSGFELTGEEFAEALLAESNEALNRLLGESIPVLESFQQLGEGLTGTLVRLGQTMSIATTQFSSFGLTVTEFSGGTPSVTSESLSGEASAKRKFDSALSAATTNRSIENVEALNQAEISLNDARQNIADQLGSFADPLVEKLRSAEIGFANATLVIGENKDAQENLLTVQKLLNHELSISASIKDNEKLGISQEVIDLFNATETLSRASKAAASALNDQGLFNLAVISDFVDAFGGLEDFVTKTNYAFENFFSEEEQLETRTRELIESFTALREEGIITASELNRLVDGQGDLKQEYREVTGRVISASNATGEFANRLFTLAPAVIEVVDAMESLDPTLESVLDRLDDFDIGLSGFGDLIEKAVRGELDPDAISGIVGEQVQDGIYGAFTSSFVADSSKLIVDNIIKPLINGAELSASTMITLTNVIQGQANAISASLSDPAFVSAMVLANKTISDTISLINELGRSNLDRADSAFTKLSDSIAKEQDRLAEEFDKNVAAIDVTIDGLNTSITEVSDSITGLEAIANALKTTIETISPVSLTKARQVIKDATQGILNGATIALDDISSSLNKLAEGDTSTFATLVEFQRSQGENARLARDLQEVVGDSLSTEEQTLLALEASLDTANNTKALLEEAFNTEVNRLDGILESAQEQLDVLHGIDSSIQSVEAALAIFADFAGKAASDNAVTSGISATQAESTSSSAAVALNKYGGGDQLTVSDAQIKAFGSQSGVTSMDLYNAAKANNVSANRVAEVLGLDKSNVANFLSSNNLPGFATGGLTGGGPVIVGEMGPEIVDLPRGSRVNTASETKNMLSNKELLEEIKRMREEMNAVLVSIATSSDKTASKITKFDNIGMPAERAAV